MKIIHVLVLAQAVCSVDISRFERLNIEIGDGVPPQDCSASLNNLETLLRASSLQIRNLTEGRVQLREVTVKLPSSWSSCAPASTLRTGGQWGSADVVVVEEHPLLGDRPWSVQYDGCRTPAKNIELPLLFVNKNLSIEARAELFTKEWAKLRFGVFEEDGFEEDNLYPDLFLEGKENLTNSGCTDKIQGFCPEQDYLEDLPTKQNILCSRRSVRSILKQVLKTEPSVSHSHNISAKIRDPESFTVSEEPSLLPLSVHYQIPDRKRFVIVLERASAMGLNSRWSLLHSQLFRFISALPNDSEVALVTYGKTASLILAPTLLTQDNREGIYGRIPRRHLEEDSACLECALKLGMKTLSLSSPTNSGTLILITASAAKPLEFDEMLQTIEESRNQVHTVAFEKSIFYEARHLARFGHTYIVHEKHHDILTGAINISDIFTAILKTAGGIQLQKFHQEQKISDDSNVVAGNFVVEESLRDNLWVQIGSPDEDDIEMFELTNPTGRVFEFPKYEHGLVYFKLQGTQEPGIWSYKARLFQKDQFVRVSIQALAEPSHKDSLVLEAWTSVDHEGVNALNTPVKLFARITSQTSPILGAEVVATVHRPGNSEPVSVLLRDNGSGYPDITRGDGIYSAYFTQFTSEPGFYSVVVSVKNRDGSARLPRLSGQAEEPNGTCCGSTLPFSYTVPITHFSRHALAGSFFVKEGSQFYLRQGSPTRNDVFPPSRITDFKLANYLDNSLYVTLKWTAPGNDYDFGQAFRYEVRCYTNRESLREENFTDMGILVHTSLIPIPEVYGVEQRSTVGIPWPNEIFYYAIVAYDEEGNRGEVSNVVSVFAEENPSTPAPSVGFDQAILDNEAYPRHESLPLTAPDNETLIYVVSGVVSAVLVVVLVILLTALYRSRWSKQIKRSTSSQIYVKDCGSSSLGGTLKKAGSLHDITKENSLNTARVWRDSDSCGKNSMRKSPIPSISDNLSWRYNHAMGQEVAGVHKVHYDSTGKHNPPSTDSSMYSSSNDSDTTASAEFILGPGPRISVMEDYTVYRDLSHLDSLQDYFSLSNLPLELQGVSIVPYSPGYETAESSKRRHISLV